jgi:hypothetical protein
MGNDPKSIGEKLRAIDEHAQKPSEIHDNVPANKEPAEGARNTVLGGGKRNNRSQTRKASGPGDLSSDQETENAE